MTKGQEITYLFEKEIRVFGMRRSGNNAVRNFVIQSFPIGTVIWISNSYLSFRKDTPFPKAQRKKMREVEPRYFFSGVEHMPTVDIGVCLKLKYLYDWERRRWAGHYGKDGFARDVYNLIIIRSPHNHLASVLRFRNDKGQYKMQYIFTGNKRHLEFTQLWIQYAEEVLNITNHVPNKIVVLFDKFVSDSYYRKSISDSLGIPYVYSAINSRLYNLKKGYGSPISSFDGHDEYAGRAQEMKVLDRWKYLIDPGEEVWWTLDECREKLLHPKVLEYTKRIFDIDLVEIL